MAFRMDFGGTVTRLGVSGPLYKGPNALLQAERVTKLRFAPSVYVP